MKELIVTAFKRSPRGTQSRVADEVGVRVQTVNKWAQGQIAPESHRWSALEESLGLDSGSIAAAAGIKLLSDAGSEEAGPLSGMMDLLDQIRNQMERLEDRVRALEQSGDPPPPSSAPGPPPSPGARRTNLGSRRSS